MDSGLLSESSTLASAPGAAYAPAGEAANGEENGEEAADAVRPFRGSEKKAENRVRIDPGSAPSPSPPPPPRRALTRSNTTDVFFKAAGPSEDKTRSKTLAKELVKDWAYAHEVLSVMVDGYEHHLTARRKLCFDEFAYQIRLQVRERAPLAL